MTRSKHSNFSKSILAVIFVFLNGICVATPAIKNSTGNYTQTSSLQFGYDLNNPETAENHLPAQTIRQQAVRRSLIPSDRAGIENINNDTTALRMHEGFNYSRSSSYFLPRPGYYIFLFRYTLF